MNGHHGKPQAVLGQCCFQEGRVDRERWGAVLTPSVPKSVCKITCTGPFITNGSSGSICCGEVSQRALTLVSMIGNRSVLTPMVSSASVLFLLKCLTLLGPLLEKLVAEERPRLMTPSELTTDSSCFPRPEPRWGTCNVRAE